MFIALTSAQLVVENAFTTLSHRSTISMTTFKPAALKQSRLSALLWSTDDSII